ncbi:MAG: hypothetical protein K6U80_07875 [Firmicutes bacterium]|nr:hypothetical protein [Bacillota bacterium]
MAGYINNVEGLSYIDYKGKKILYINYQPLNNDKAKVYKLIEGCAAEELRQPDKSVLALTNVEGFHFDMDVLKKFKESVAKTKIKEKKVALIGVKGLLKVAYNFVVSLTDPTTKVFDTEAEAKEWLVAD